MTAGEAVMYAVGPSDPAWPAGEPDYGRPGGRPVEIVNVILHHLQAACDGCILLTRWYTGEPRVDVTAVAVEGAQSCRRIDGEARADPGSGPSVGELIQPEELSTGVDPGLEIIERDPGVGHLLRHRMAAAGDGQLGAAGQLPRPRLGYGRDAVGVAAHLPVLGR